MALFILLVFSIEKLKMSKYFLTKKEVYQKLGQTGGDSFFITKDNLVDLGADASLLEKYGSNEFVVDDDIILAPTDPVQPQMPIILFDPGANTFSEDFKTYTDPISGFVFTAQGTPTINKVENNGIPRFVINSRGAQNVWVTPWANIQPLWDSIFKNGNFTVVFIENMNSINMGRQGVLAFYNNCQISGWRDGNSNYGISSLYVKALTNGQNMNTLINPLKLTNDGAALYFYSVDREKKIVLSSGKRNESEQDIDTGFEFSTIKREFTVNGSINGYNSSTAAAQGLFIGRSQEYDYYMYQGNFIGGVAIYDYALSERELKWLWENKAVTAERLKKIFEFSGSSSGDRKYTLSAPFDMTKSFRIICNFKLNTTTWSSGGIVHIYNGASDANLDEGVIIQAEAFKQSGNTPYLNISVRPFSGQILRLTPIAYNTNYNIYIEYNSKTKMVKVKANEQEAEGTSTIDSFGGNKSFDYVMLSGHPRWSNGDCSVTFTELKIEVAE